MKCYISHNYKGTTSAGNKAKTDVEKILQEEGFRNIGLRQTHFRNKILSFFLTAGSMARACFLLRKGDVLVLQYPLKKYFHKMCRVAHGRNARVVVLVHDLGCFRRQALSAEQDIALLNETDCVIALNENMKGWLAAHGCGVPVVTLDFWDYLSKHETRVRQGMHRPVQVAYAGSLNRRKNAFLYEWAKEKHPFRLSLYGHRFEQTEVDASFARFNGFVLADDFIAHNTDDFGLVWDGPSKETCTGSYGDYLRLNVPHKAAFYIRSGMPIIVWTESGIAPLVQRLGIGLCVSSLVELDTLLPSVTEQSYREMTMNVKKMASRLERGDFFRAALHRALAEL